ncbi:MAG: DUF2844 domain-containing protein [Candidatus Korobacteraceae bacterium]
MNYFKRVGVRSEKVTRIVISFLVLVLPLPAMAVLGDTAGSVLTDQVRMKGTLHSQDAHTYIVHEITTPTGSVVREFVPPAGGAVFGVAWEGQFPPDLQQLLGPYYGQAKQAVAQEQHRGRVPVVIETPGLVMYQTGHMRSYHGQAYIPQLLPQGVQSKDIR